MAFGFQVFGQREGNAAKTETAYSGEEIVLNAGYGTYLMSDLKDVQKFVISNNDIALQVTSSFPEYYNYSFRYGKRLKNCYEGFTAGLMSTGARSSLADYSGFIYSDINCQAIYIGYYYQKEFFSTFFLNRRLECGYNLNLSIIGSNIDMTDRLNLYDNTTENNDVVQTNKYTFNAIGIYTEPLLYTRYMFFSRLGIELNAGGGLSLSSPLYYKAYYNSIKINNQNRYVNWSGLRVSVGLICKL